MIEKWVPFRHGYYEVSNLGRVRRVKPEASTYPGKILKAAPSKGYLHVVTCFHGRTKTHTVHQLVASAFIGPCPRGKEVHHRDENNVNNRWDNLRYVNSKKHRRSHKIKLTNHQARRVRSLYSTGKFTQRSLAEMFDVNVATINNRIWKKY